MKLHRAIGPISLMFTAVGGIVGSGWLLGPLYAAQAAGPAAIVSWVLGGLLMMVIALTFAELASTFPVAGSVVRFAHFSHGPFVSYTMAWISWLAAVIVAPIETMALLQYASNYIPWLAHKVGGTYHITMAGTGVAAAIMFIMCCINVYGIKLVTKTNSVIVCWKLIIPIVTVIFLFHGRFSSANFTHFAGFMPNGIHGILVALPTAGVIFSFIGYSPAMQLAGEAKNPQRTVPIAIIGALSLCIILYVIIQTAFIGALTPAELKQGWQHIAFSKDAGPIAGIMTALGFAWFVKILYFDAVISPFGTAFVYTASTARMNYAMSQNGYMPHVLMKLNKKGVPVVAIAVNFIIGMLFYLPFPGWQSLVSFLVSCFVIAYAVGPISMLALRYKMPEQPRPFRLPYATFFGYLAFYICNLIVYWTGWHTVSHMLLTIAIGYVFLIIYKISKAGRKTDLKIHNGYWLFPYFIGLGIISYLGAFGGTHIIPFGWDFAVIAVFSSAIFYVAVNSFDTKIDQCIISKEITACVEI